MTQPRKHRHAALIKAWLDDDSLEVEYAKDSVRLPELGTGGCVVKEPIKAGDLAHVIGGMSGIGKGPNVGLVVKVVRFVYECPRLGRIWRCEAEFAERLVIGPGCTCPPGHADFAQSWLRKIAPPPFIKSTRNKELSL